MPIDLDQLLTAAPRAQALTPTAWVSSYWLFLEAGVPPPPAGMPEGLRVVMAAPTRRAPRRVAPEVPSPWMRLLLAAQDLPVGRSSLNPPVRRAPRGPGGFTDPRHLERLWRRNMITGNESDFETGIDAWRAQNSAAVSHQTSGGGFGGSAGYMRVITNGAGGDEGANLHQDAGQPITVRPLTSYTFRVKARAEVSGPYTYHLNVNEYEGGSYLTTQVGPNVVFPASDAWVQLDFTFTTGASTNRLHLFVLTAGAFASTIFVDEAELWLADPVQPNGAVTMPAGVRRPRRGPGGLAAGTSAPLYSLAPTNQAQYLMPSRATRWRPQTRRREPLVLTGALNLLLAVVVEDLPAGKQAAPSVVRLAPSKRHAQALGMPNTLTAPPPTTNQAQYAMPSRSLRWPARRRREYMHTPLGSYLDLLVTPFEMASALVPSKVVRRRDVTWRARSVTLANPLGLLLHPNDLPDGAQLTPLPAPLRRRVPRGLEVVPLPNLEPTPIGDPVVRANDFTRPVRLPRRAPLDHTRHNPLLLLTFTALPPAAPFTPTVVRRPRRAPLTWSSSGLLLLLPPTPIGDPPPGSQLTTGPVRLRDALREWRSFAGYNAALLHDAGSDFAPQIATYLLGLIPGYPDVIDLGALAGYPDVLDLATIPGYPGWIEVGDIARG